MGSKLCCGRVQCSCMLADMICLVCRSYGVHAKAVLGLYGMLECKLCFEILLLLNMADMNCLLLHVEGCGVSSACLVLVDRLMNM